MILNIENGKRYIGQSVNIEHRWTNHKSCLNNNIHYNTHLQNAWNKYGEESFKLYILEECEKDDLNEKEIFYIQKHNSLNSNYGYNLTSGGEGSSNTKEETRIKQSKGIKRHYEEHPEARILQRENAIKQFQDKEFYERYIAYRHSAEYRAKFSKRVMCVETGIIYPSVTNAKETLGIFNISTAARSGKKAGGYHWKYIDETENRTIA